MIYLAALVLGSQIGGFIHVPDPNAKETTVQTIVRLPELLPVERATLGLIADVAPRQTEDYIRRDMLLMTDGRTIRMSLMPDCLRLSVTVSGSDPVPAISITESVLRRAFFRQEDLDAAVRLQGQRNVDPWMSALKPSLPAPLTRREVVLDLYRRVVTPSSTTLILGGSADPEIAREEWTRRIASWQAPRDKIPSRHIRSAAAKPADTDWRIFDFRGPEFPAGDPAIPTKIIALIALGSGKGSALHRVWRESKGWSYRQESVLMPTANGWQTHLLAAMATKELQVDELRKALAGAIDTWEESDRNRAMGMARGILFHGVPFSPLYLGAYGPLGQDLADRTYLAGYWQWKTGSSWNPSRLIELMSVISLDELKSTAKELVE